MNKNDFYIETERGPAPFHFLEGYYLVHFAGCSCSDILWCDGDALYAPGMIEPVDISIILFISSEPINLNAIPVQAMLYSNLNPDQT